MQETIHLICSVGLNKFYCLGSNVENRRIVQGEQTYHTANEFVKSFPELRNSPLELAKCLNFLFVGDLFTILCNSDITSEVIPPFIHDDTLVYYSWNQVNDRLYKTSCALPECSNIRYILIDS